MNVKVVFLNAAENFNHFFLEEVLSFRSLSFKATRGSGIFRDCGVEEEVLVPPAFFLTIGDADRVLTFAAELFLFVSKEPLLLPDLLACSSWSSREALASEFVTFC